MDEVIEAILDMEKRLKADNDGTYRKELQDKFSEVLNKTKKTMDGGLPKEQFEAINKLKKAMETASSVVDVIWKGMHEKAY